jgi:hypothetical protein
LETAFYSEIRPIEPEPGNAGAGNKKLKRVSASPELFFLDQLHIYAWNKLENWLLRISL